MPTFPFSDGWLLTTLWAIKDPCDRERLNEVGDVFNHSIFLDEEVTGGMRRLERIGFAQTLEDGRFAITSLGTSFVRSRWDDREGHIKNMLKVCAALQQEEA